MYNVFPRLNYKKNCVLSKKSKTVIATYVYASEGSRFALLENGAGFML